MTPTPTVERVARALFESDMKWAPIVEHQFEENRQMYFAASRAAIEAMHNVGDIPITKIYALIDKICPENEIGPDEVAAIWHAMLDAALGRGGV